MTMRGAPQRISFGIWIQQMSNVVAAATNTNLGIRQRALLAQGGLTVQTLIPLNRYSFFEELNDKLLPPMQLEFEVELQSDEELIWQNDGTNRRIVVRKFELWVPMLRFTAEGQKLANENFLKPQKWTYLNEMVQPSSSRRDAFGQWQINPGIAEAKHVFIFFQQSRKVKAFTQNPYFFDTFDLDGDNSAKLSTCRLKYGSSQFYPELDYDENFKLRILNDLDELSVPQKRLQHGCSASAQQLRDTVPNTLFRSA